MSQLPLPTTLNPFTSSTMQNHMQVLSRFWADDAAQVISAELVLIMTIVGIGMIVGLTTYRDQIVFEFTDLAVALAQFNQSYSYAAVTGPQSSVAGSIYVD